MDHNPISPRAPVEGSWPLVVLRETPSCAPGGRRGVGTGATGAAGTATVTIVTQAGGPFSQALTKAGTTSTTATCATGKAILGGGATASTSPAASIVNVQIYDSHPTMSSGTGSWTAAVSGDPGGGGNTASITVFAICAQ